MKNGKLILTAVILSGSIGFGGVPVLAQGASGAKGAGATASADEIKKAEEALKAQGLNPGPIDGKMDSQTEQALREFQKKNKLAVTGSLDQQTAEKLGVKLGGAKGSPSQQPGKESSTPQTKGATPQDKMK